MENWHIYLDICLLYRARVWKTNNFRKNSQKSGAWTHVSIYLYSICALPNFIQKRQLKYENIWKVLLCFLHILIQPVFTVLQQLAATKGLAVLTTEIHDITYNVHVLRAPYMVRVLAFQRKHNTYFYSNTQIVTIKCLKARNVPFKKT